MWDIPLSLNTPLTFYDTMLSDRPARFTSCCINGSNTSGYSFSNDSKKLIAHGPDEDLSYYDASFWRNKFSLWIYMPVDPDEWVSDIWLRRGRISLDSALVVSIGFCQSLLDLVV